MSIPGLFDPLPPLFRRKLTARLAALAAQGIYFGTSSWKYEGWIGRIYTEDRYLTRGKFSRKKFEENCLVEYAEVFPAVCGDFSFYQFPSEDYWRRLFGAAPGSLKFAFKVPEEITVKVWPGHARYGARAGGENPSFLDAELFRRLFLEMLEPYRERVPALIFEFGMFSRKNFEMPGDFLHLLDAFLAALPVRWRYAVEIRNPEYLGADYLACLRQHRVAHVFNAWTRMPELGTQIRIPDVITTDFTMTRALLKRGRSYENAVKQFEPYRKVQEENPGARDALREIVRHARANRQGAFVFVNNRLEGNAPETIAAVVGEDE
jgi:uncharacterized protein YecE (DUF72 family)